MSRHVRINGFGKSGKSWHPEVVPIALTDSMGIPVGVDDSKDIDSDDDETSSERMHPSFNGSIRSGKLIELADGSIVTRAEWREIQTQ